MSNVFSFTGTVGRDAEVRYSASGLAILSVTVANNIGFGDKQQTLWVQVALFGKRAEGGLQNYLKKGQQVFVSGELSQREYKANDGTTRTALEVNANIIDLVGRKNEAGQQTQPNSQQSASRARTSTPPDGVYDNLDMPYDDDVPF